MKMTASLTSLNVRGMDQTGNPSVCPSLSSFSRRAPIWWGSEHKMFCMVIFHISLHLHTSAFRLVKGVWVLVQLSRWAGQTWRVPC